MAFIYACDSVCLSLEVMQPSELGSEFIFFKVLLTWKVQMHAGRN